MQDKNVQYIPNENFSTKYDFVKNIDEETIVDSLKINIPLCQDCCRLN
ncbi:hypothetical protein [Candidatus Colwellia aromaticivorans]|nr:hypothetical protein [Candidatus Colwellia aromaticivorans]